MEQKKKQYTAPAVIALGSATTHTLGSDTGDNLEPFSISGPSYQGSHGSDQGDPHP